MTDMPNPTEAESPGFAASARQRAIEAYESARGQASDGLREAPLLALAGGLAAGALIAALLPRTEAETKALKPTVRRVKETARAAADAARETGSNRLSELGLTRERGEQTLRELFDGATDAVKASASAALDAARRKG